MESNGTQSVKCYESISFSKHLMEEKWTSAMQMSFSECQSGSVRRTSRKFNFSSTTTTIAETTENNKLFRVEFNWKCFTFSSPFGRFIELAQFFRNFLIVFSNISDSSNKSNYANGSFSSGGWSAPLCPSPPTITTTTNQMQLTMAIIFLSRCLAVARYIWLPYFCIYDTYHCCLEHHVHEPDPSSCVQHHHTMWPWLSYINFVNWNCR